MNPLCWSFIRTKTREAMFSGIQDAFDLVEKSGGDVDSLESTVLVEEVSQNQQRIRTDSNEPKIPNGLQLKSAWDEIRTKTRDAVLVGMREALGDQQCSQAA